MVAKTFQEDTNFNLFLVLDTSASMGYKGAGSSSTKLHYASMLARALLTLPLGRATGLVYLLMVMKSSRGFVPKADMLILEE